MIDRDQVKGAGCVVLFWAVIAFGVWLVANGFKDAIGWVMVAAIVLVIIVGASAFIYTIGRDEL